MITEFDKAEAKVHRAAKATEAKLSILKAPPDYVDGYKAGVSGMVEMTVWLMRCAKREEEREAE